MKNFEQRKELLIDYYNQGLSNREICLYFNVHHTTISSWLKKLNLKSRYRQSIDFINEHEARCKKCKEVKSINEFQFNRKNSIGQYQLAYCNSCRKKQSYLNLNSDIKKFLKNRYNRLKLHLIKKSIPFDLDIDYILDVYNKQKGLCFYSGIKMNLEVGKGLKSTSLSFDKVIPEKGYIKGNIVLTINKFNVVKQDLNLEELKLYIPLFYQKIIECKWLNIK